MLFEPFGSQSSRGWFHSCLWPQWDRAPGVLEPCRAATGSAMSVNHCLLSPWAGTEVCTAGFCFLIAIDQGIFKVQQTCTLTMSLNFSRVSSFCCEIHLTVNTSPISVLKEPAGMVEEIFCNLLLVFRNQSRLDKSFRKTTCVCAFNSTKIRSCKMGREKKHEKSERKTGSHWY